MRLLLDTQALIWTLSQPAKLPASVRSTLEDSANAVFASAASAWEIAIKRALGKLDFPSQVLSDALAAAAISELPVAMRHTLSLGSLPPHHRDPFDRMLIAQAKTEGLTLVSNDPQIWRYDVAWLWAKTR